MADLRLSRASALAARWAALPLALRIGLVYAAGRLVTLGFFGVAAAVASARSGTTVSVADLSMKWDAAWYWLIGTTGYPSDLPLTAAGQVEQNPWAFLPLYPALARVVGSVGGSWPVGAVIVSLAAGYVACLLLHALLRPRLDATAALWAVVLFANGPLAALFQVGYAEALGLVWLLLVLLMVARRRWVLAGLAVLLFGATRPGALAVALFVALLLVWRLRRRAQEPLPRADIVGMAALAVWAGVVGLAWSPIAALVTGRADAYLATELAWRRVWLGPVDSAFVPFEGFVQGVAFWAGQWRVGVLIVGALTVAAVIGFFVALALVPQVRRLGIELRLWSASYALYLLAVFFPQSSIFRLLYPLTPLVGAVAAPRSTTWRVGVLAAGLVLQAAWIVVDWGIGATFFQVP